MIDNDLKKYLSSVPEYLQDKTLKDLPEELQTKYDIFCTEKLNNYRVFILTGNESEDKEIFIACMLTQFVKEQHKKILYINTPSVDIQQTFNPELIWTFAYSQVDKTTMINKIRNAMLGQLARGRILILGCDSMQSLEDVYGASFVSSVSSKALEIDLSVAREEIEVL